MSEANQNYDCFPDCWEYNEPFALSLFKKKATKLLNETGNLEEYRIDNTNLYNFTLELNILGNYGVYEETFDYPVDRLAKVLIASYELNQLTTK